MAALRSHGMVRIHVIKKLLDWPAVRLVRHQVEPGQVRQPSERHRPSTLCHPEAEGLRCVMSPAGRKPSVLDHWTGRHDSTQVLKRFSVDRHDRFRRPRGEDFGPELARVRNGFPASMQRGKIGRPEGHKIRRQYARLDKVACGFGHTNDARYSVEDLLNLKLQRSGADGVPLPGLDPVRATVFRTRLGCARFSCLPPGFNVMNANRVSAVNVRRGPTRNRQPSWWPSRAYAASMDSTHCSKLGKDGRLSFIGVLARQVPSGSHAAVRLCSSSPIAPATEIQEGSKSKRGMFMARAMAVIRWS